MEFILYYFIILSVNAYATYSKFINRNISVVEGTSLPLPCKVHNTEVYCLWFRNKNLTYIHTSNEGDCSYILDRVNLTYDGEWQCKIFQAESDKKAKLLLSSIIIKLTVLVKPERPKIFRVPEYSEKLNVSTNNSSNEVICTVLKGNPPPVINWFLDEYNITSQSITTINRGASNEVIGVTSKLLLNFTRDHNNSTIKCLALHETGNQKDSARLNVLYPPILHVEKSSYSVRDGSELKITCHVDANPRSEARWRIKEGSDVSLSEPNILYFNKVDKKMNGRIYECYSFNYQGIGKPAVVQINVLYPPQVFNISKKLAVKLGNNEKMYCIFDGSPRPKVEWFQINPLDGVHHPLTNKLDNDQIIEIRNATYLHEGEYYCQATNNIDGERKTVRSDLMILDVYGAPDFTIKIPAYEEGRRGGQSRLALRFCSDPPPHKVFWQFGSYQLDVKSMDYNFNNLRPDAINKLRYKVQPLSTIQTKEKMNEFYKCYESKLIIEETDISDQRDYTLLVENNLGSQQAVVKLKVVSPLSPTLMVATALSLIITVCILSLVFLLIFKCRRKNKDDEDEDDEAKEDVEVLPQTINTNNTESLKPNLSKSANGNTENHELVYANLSFPKDNKPPVTRPKPIIHQRSNNKNNQNNTTEYEKLSFPSEADL